MPSTTGYLSVKDKYNLNYKRGTVNSDVLMGTVVDQAQRVQRVTVGYASLVDGSAVTFGEYIPDNAIITQVFIDVTTTFVGNVDDSSTIKMGIEDQDDDTVAAVAISNGANPWDAGIKAGIQVDTAATMVKLSARRKLAVTWTSNADSALTAGSMDVFISWVQGN